MAHYALQKLHILPSQIALMSPRERAFFYASILQRIESEKKEQEKLKRIKTSGKRR